MPLIPLKGKVFGRVIYEQDARHVVSHVRDRGKAVTSRPSSLIISPVAKKMPYVMRVEGVHPSCHDIHVGDIAILPDHGGAVVTVFDDETGESEKMFTIAEDDILCVFREETSARSTAA